MARVSYGKLSKLQRFIMMCVLTPEGEAMSRREFSRMIYEKFFGEETASNRASLSRAYRRLEHREYLRRVNGCWKLNNETADGNGILIAGLLWLDLRKQEAATRKGS
jgi:hypothetical protein